MRKRVGCQRISNKKEKARMLPRANPNILAMDKALGLFHFTLTGELDIIELNGFTIQSTYFFIGNLIFDCHKPRQLIQICLLINLNLNIAEVNAMSRHRSTLTLLPFLLGVFGGEFRY